ncbi:MAG: hypothetical protein WAO91_01550 [Candidatus Nitrosotenuis sp.]
MVTKIGIIVGLVMVLVLLGVLEGINSVFCSMEVKDEKWNEINQERCDKTNFLTQLIRFFIELRKESLTE